MPTFIPSAWAAIVLLFLFLCTQRPPNDPSPAIVAGQDQQLTFFERWCETVDPTADLWDDARRHVRTRDDLH